MDSLRTLKFARNGYIVISLVFCAMGLWMIWKPIAAAEYLRLLVGSILVTYGVIKVVGYCAKDFYCLAFQFDLSLGLLMGAVGVILLARRSAAQVMVFTIVGLVLLADSLFKIQICIDAKKFGLDLWWRILLVAFAAGTLGTLILSFPIEGISIALKIMGSAMIAEGILNLLVSIYMVKILEVSGAGGEGAA